MLMPRFVFCGQKCSPQQRLYSQQLKEIGRDCFNPDVLGPSTCQQRSQYGWCWSRHNRTLDTAVVIPHFQEIQRANGAKGLRRPGIELHDHEKAVRFHIWERAKQHCIYDAENAGIDPHAERNRHHGNRGKSSVLPQQASTET